MKDRLEEESRPYLDSFPMIKNSLQDFNGLPDTLQFIRGQPLKVLRQILDSPPAPLLHQLHPPCRRA